jgi:MFS superfamily sulfate permease-like transporter
MDITKIKSDLPASLVVFLVALPLCLGVALASGAPLLSGILAGIIGGIVVGFISDSHSSVSGPAAGLAAVVFSAITQLGNYETFLLAVVIAGGIQLIAGITKMGFIANFIPSNVIKGLLAAIGIILILKQIQYAIGYNKDRENDFSFFKVDGDNTFSELINMLNNFSYGAVLISVVSLLVLVFWDKTPMKQFKFFPASLFVVILGVAMNYLFNQFIPKLAIGSNHMVRIPKFEGISSLVTMPSFKSIVNPQVWIVAFTIAIVASIETLLNLEAIENVDPHKRQASPNKELVAQGIGNLLSGLIGGIPITSVIVRSSVNLNAGAETKLSAILHGLFLLISVLVLSPIINLIPLASLATILLVTGYKLAKISLFKEMYKNGLNQFIPFIATIVAIVFTDLLIGVLVGSFISIFYILKSNFKNAYHFQKDSYHTGEVITITLSEEVSFLNKGSIKEMLFKEIPPNSQVILDGSKSTYIDFDVLEIISDFLTIHAIEKNISIQAIGIKSHYEKEVRGHVESEKIKS